jgi:hypothetical protein
MDFRTELTIDPTSFSIGLNDGIVTIGSCFSDAIGEKLRQNKFLVLANPLGVVYNPLSIHKLLLMALEKENPQADGYCERDGLFLHHDFHSSFAEKSRELLQNTLLGQLSRIGDALRSCRVLIITYGTAWVYEQKSIRQVVANCHKIPQQQFDKFLLTQKRILESFEAFHKAILEVNPTVKIILTVSPVRHIKDTLELNSVSKATLRLTCHTLTKANPNVVYFPAYELMVDDLRDYRFYKSDLIHPTAQAEAYIWEKFCNAYFATDTIDFLRRWNKIQSALHHRPFNPNSDSHQKFLKALLVELNELHNTVDVRAEIGLVQKQLSH